MKTIIVDDEELARRQFEMECEPITWVEIVGSFEHTKEALEYVKNNKVEAAFLDIEMPEMNGIMLGKKMREINPQLVVIFLTGYDNYTLEALHMKADYYLMKPYSTEDIRETLDRARLLTKRQRKRVFFRTFGRFDLLIDGHVVRISNTKAKELLALCVDHKGGSVTMEEAIDKLWEDRVYDERVKNLYRKAVMSLKQIFKDYDLEQIFISKRGACNIDYNEVDCDYFEWLELGRNAHRKKEKITGGYMPEYSWAEETNALLEM